MIRCAAGALGRMALTFAASCLALTLLPLVLGWQPFVVKSGSMEPHIGIGDVLLASPDHDGAQLLGHVTVFADPANPGHDKSHRVIRIEPDGTLQTKGDANPTPDPATVPLTAVVGIGRLLVPGAGMPMVWLRSGWSGAGRLLLLLLLLGAAAWAVARDREDEGGSLRLRLVTGPGLAVAGSMVLLVPAASAGFTGRTTNSASSWSASSQHYTGAINALGPYFSWPLTDSGSVAADASGNGRTGTYAGGVTTGVTGATPDDAPNQAVALTNSSSCLTTTSITPVVGPAVFTEIVWFKAPSSYTRGGRLIGFENPRTGIGLAGVGTYDRMIYLDGAGKVWFGVYNNGFLGFNGYVGIASPASYTDGAWHMAAATLGPSGMALYVDGQLRSTSTNTVNQASTGWWRVGCGNLAGWGASWTGPNNPDQNLINLVYNAYFTGSVDEASVFAGQALSSTQIAQLYFAR